MPVCVHLDHGEDLDYIKRALDLGFTSVMHGGSGISDKDFKEVIKRGIRKVNYYTYMARAGAEAVANKKYTQFHDILNYAEIGMKENVKQAMLVFSDVD